MKKTAILFPGQGSQEVGMGARMAASFSSAAQCFEQASDVLGYSVTELCFHDPNNLLNQTEYSQPALYTTCMAYWNTVSEQFGPRIFPFCFAGHSLGQFTALGSANSYSFDDGLLLVHKRASLMAEAGKQAPGGMAVVIGGDLLSLQQTCATLQQQHGYVLVIANDNAPGQVVLSGDLAALQAIKDLKSQLGYKLFRQLPISVACHSARMSIVQPDFDHSINATPFEPAAAPLMANTSATLIQAPDPIRSELKEQLCGPVRWQESILALSALGIEQFLEIGPGEVLTGLVKRILPSAECIHFSHPEDLDAVQQWLDGGNH